MKLMLDHIRDEGHEENWVLTRGMTVAGCSHIRSARIPCARFLSHDNLF